MITKGGEGSPACLSFILISLSPDFLHHNSIEQCDAGSREAETFSQHRQIVLGMSSFCSKGDGRSSTAEMGGEVGLGILTNKAGK